MQDELPTDLPIYEKQLRETETAIDNIATAIMNGVASKALQAKLTQLEATQDELKGLIAQEKLEKPKVTARQMTFFLHRFRKLDMTIEKHRQTLIDTFVNAVFVHDNKILLTFNFEDGTRTITLSDIEAAANESGSDLEMFGAPCSHPDFDRVRVGFFFLIFDELPIFPVFSEQIKSKCFFVSQKHFR